MPKSSVKTRSRSRSKKRSASKQVEVPIEDDTPSMLDQVRGLEATASELLDKADTLHNTVGQALSLACECFQLAIFRLEKDELKTKGSTPAKHTDNS